MKKNFLYIGGFNLPDKNAAAQRVIANAKIIRFLGYDVTLVGLTHDRSGLKPFKFEDFSCINLPYPKTIREWWRMLTSIKQYLPFYSEDTAIVVAYNHPAVALKKLLKHNRKKGIKTISDCTEWYEPYGGWLFRLIKGWDVNQRMYKVHPQLDGIITISRYLDVFYKERDVKTLLLPPLVDKSEEKWKRSDNIDTDTIKLLYAGSPGGTKDRLDIIINALRAIENEINHSLSFDVIGITEYQYRKVYLSGSQQLLPKFVHFQGRLPHEKVIEMLKSSDFQIFLRENHLANKAGFPTKFVETISAGTIVLTNASSNLKDYMIEGVNSFELDISGQDILQKTLHKALSLTKNEIANIKKHIDTEIFDYKNYIEQTRTFLNTID